MLDREQILASRSDRKPVRLEVPEWGGDVFVRLMSARESLELTDRPNQSDMIFEVLIATLVTEDGTQLFRSEDRAWLEEEPFQVILRVFTAAARANGIPVGNAEEAMEVFTPAPDASSSTG